MNHVHRYLTSILRNTASHATRQYALGPRVLSQEQHEEAVVDRAYDSYLQKQKAAFNQFGDIVYSAINANSPAVATEFRKEYNKELGRTFMHGLSETARKEIARDLARTYMKKGKTSHKSIMPRVIGKGDYTWKDYTGALATGIGSGLGGLAGAALGGPPGAAGGVTMGGALGGAVGSALGGTLGHDIARMVGMGDYTVGVNTIYKKGFKIAPGMPIPEFGGSASRTRIRHREYVGDVFATGNTDFFVKSYVINPGNSTLFPWLSVIAQNYSQYEFKGLVAQFVSTTSDITAGGGLGSVIMGTNYDVLQADYVSKQAMENAQFCVSARPSQSIVHTFECDPKLRPLQKLYIRDLSSSTTVSQDARFYDMGKFQVAVTGVPAVIAAGTQLGELWLSYDIEFDKADIADPFLLFMGRGDAFIFNATNRATITDADPFGTTSFPVTTGALGGVVSRDVYTFPSFAKGTQFYVHATWLGTPAIGTAIIDIVGVGCTIANRIGYPDIAGGADLSDRVGTTFRVTLTSNTAPTLTFSTTGVIFPTACTQCILYVIPVNPSLTWI